MSSRNHAHLSGAIQTDFSSSGSVWDFHFSASFTSADHHRRCQFEVKRQNKERNKKKKKQLRAE